MEVHAMKKGGSVLATLCLTSVGLMAPASSSATSTTACTGVSGCRIVASIDIDGDGRADQVGVIGKALSGDNGTITVRVRRAVTGRTIQTTSRRIYWAHNAFVGAAPVDGVKGAEILVGDLSGAHYQQFRMITYRGGRLVTANPPPRAGMLSRASRWGADISYSSNIGLYRTVSRGKVTMTVRTARRNDSGYGHHGQIAVYTWRSSRWVTVSRKAVSYDTDRAAFIGGLWIEGLPPYGGYHYPMSFPRCSALNSFYPHGVGRHGAKDKTKGSPVTTFYRDEGLYRANDGPRAGSQRDLDPDNDGIACEKR
jgi:hypothetical protein